MKKEVTVEFSKERLREDLEIEARTIGIPEGMAVPIAQKVAHKVAAWVATRSVITNDDLNHKVAEEVRKFSSDLAYIYENRGTII